LRNVGRWQSPQVIYEKWQHTGVILPRRKFTAHFVKIY
jgi:hypothetical protein